MLSKGHDQPVYGLVQRIGETQELRLCLFRVVMHVSVIHVHTKCLQLQRYVALF